MTVWAEGVSDGGSAVWCCTTCLHGGWCSSRLDAIAEALRHAQGHGLTSISIVERQHGPKPDESRDQRIHRMRGQGLSIRAIAAAVGLSTAGVIKALRRPRENA